MQTVTVSLEFVKRTLFAPLYRELGRYPIVIVNGSRGPRLLGDAPHYTNARGELVRHPNAYRKAFGRPVRHASTRRIEIGAMWLARRVWGGTK